MKQPSKQLKIRDLNDQFRHTFLGGTICLPRGVQELDENTKAHLLMLVREFDDFSEENDPHGEHDFGSIGRDGNTYFWKIDAFDPGLQFPSHEPIDPACTARVLTIMLAEEY